MIRAGGMLERARLLMVNRGFDFDALYEARKLASEALERGADETEGSLIIAECAERLLNAGHQEAEGVAKGFYARAFNDRFDAQAGRAYLVFLAKFGTEEEALQLASKLEMVAWRDGRFEPDRFDAALTGLCAGVIGNLEQPLLAPRWKNTEGACKSEEQRKELKKTILCLKEAPWVELPTDLVVNAVVDPQTLSLWKATVAVERLPEEKRKAADKCIRKGDKEGVHALGLETLRRCKELGTLWTVKYDRKSTTVKEVAKFY
jgi:hypothetical protein